MLSLVGGLGALALAAAPARGADLRPMVANGLTGTLTIHQDLPGLCDNLDFSVNVIDGGMEISPAGGVDDAGNKLFMFTRLNVQFQPFHTHVECYLQTDDRTYTEIGASLGRAVTFTGLAAGGGLYNFTISKDAFVVNEAAIENANGGPNQSDTSLKHPASDVTGSINLATGAVEVHVTINTQLQISVGPFNVGENGHQTADIFGTLAFPDTDGDGIPDITDNCPFTPNPDQTPVPTPVVTPPPPVTLLSCLDRHFGFATATDVCFARPVTVTNNAPDPFVRGANPFLWSANDGVDAIVTAGQTVTIDDKTPPTFLTTPDDITLNDCKALSAVPLGLPTGSDDCGGAVTFTNNAPPYFLVGPTNVTWTAHDLSGNTSPSTQTVTVIDTTPPTVSCVATSPTGNGFRVTASDHCDVPVIRLGPYVLGQGEVVQIQETGQAGVQLVNNISNDGIRHFQVGKGEAVITATDASHNVATAVCIK
jgi:hypothetical protein